MSEAAAIFAGHETTRFERPMFWTIVHVLCDELTPSAAGTSGTQVAISCVFTPWPMGSRLSNFMICGILAAR